MRDKGFSLLELLVAIAIAGIILSLVSYALVESMKTWQRERTEFEELRSVESFMRALRGDMRSSVYDGIRYPDGTLRVEFASRFENGMDAVMSVSEYSIREEQGKPAAVRTVFYAGEAVSETVYRGVGGFSVHRAGGLPAFELEAVAERTGRVKAETVFAPAWGNTE